MTLECACKFLYLRTTDGAFPPFGLDIDHIQPKPIFFDDAVDSAVSTSSNRLASISKTATVTHPHQQIDDEPFKERWRRAHDSLKQFRFES